jgi:hypothetical protein
MKPAALLSKRLLPLSQNHCAEDHWQEVWSKSTKTLGATTQKTAITVLKITGRKYGVNPRKH